MQFLKMIRCDRNEAPLITYWEYLCLVLDTFLDVRYCLLPFPSWQTAVFTVPVSTPAFISQLHVQATCRLDFTVWVGLPSLSSSWNNLLQCIGNMLILIISTILGSIQVRRFQTPVRFICDIFFIFCPPLFPLTVATQHNFLLMLQILWCHW